MASKMLHAFRMERSRKQKLVIEGTVRARVVGAERGLPATGVGGICRANISPLWRKMADLTDPQNELIRRERDFYLRLLDLGSEDEFHPFIQGALQLITEMVGAHQGYLELRGNEESGSPTWWAAHGFSADDVEKVRTLVSQGIIAEALQTGQTIATRSALLDPRFSSRDSVLGGRIEAVLCAPIGESAPLGVLYLQKRDEPGPFSEADRGKVEIIARHLRAFAERLLFRHRELDETDHTRSVRERLRLDGVIGRSASLAALLDEVAAVAPLDVNVLLTGDSGTGKSQIARVIHHNGPRAGGPFVELNCAAIPEDLIESELFGALPGAHSTAARRIEGKVASAEGGTLFLDEVSDLSISAQGKLLQLMQSRIYYPLGSAKPVSADARIIAATNIDLECAVKQHRFREDLLYRLQVLHIRVPSLAERSEDIAELVAYFCSAACKRNRLHRLTLSPEALRAIEAAEWPGNIRQLSNVVEAAAIRAASKGSVRIERAHVFPASLSPRGERADRAGAGAAPSSEGANLTFQEATRRFQADLLRQTLKEANWNIVEAARRLDVTRSHVYNLIRAFGLERERS
jgi:Nif-specific regulatory protein